VNIIKSELALLFTRDT